MARRSGTQTPASILGGRPIAKLRAFVVDVDVLTKQPVVELVNMLGEWSQCRLIFVSNRSDRERPVAMQWLQSMIILFDVLIMRSDSDHRDEWFVMRDIYEEDIEPTYDVRGVFCNKPVIADMWRRYGIVCYSS